VTSGAIDAIIVQQASRGIWQMQLDVTAVLHDRYAAAHQMDQLRAVRQWERWNRWQLLAWAVQHYAYVFWIDSDAAIVGGEDLRLAVQERPIGMVWGQDRRGAEPLACNNGVLYLRATPEVRTWVAEICAHEPAATTDFSDTWWSDAGRILYDAWITLALADDPRWRDLYGKLPARWNSIAGVSQVTEPVVMAWHGYGSQQERLAAMLAARERGWRW
jgi:hypothetical protein